MSKMIYKGASNLDFVQSILLRAGCIVLIIYLAIHYEENPPVILVFNLIIIFVFLVLGNDEITIYSDKFVQTDMSIVAFILNQKGKRYNIVDIKSATLPEETAPSVSELGIILILLSLLPKRIRHKSKRQFYLDLTSGETVTIQSDLAQSKIEEIVRMLNSIV